MPGSATNKLRMPLSAEQFLSSLRLEASHFSNHTESKEASKCFDNVDSVLVHKTLLKHNEPLKTVSANTVLFVPLWTSAATSHLQPVRPMPPLVPVCDALFQSSSQFAILRVCQCFHQARHDATVCPRSPPPSQIAHTSSAFASSTFYPFLHFFHQFLHNCRVLQPISSVGRVKQ